MPHTPHSVTYLQFLRESARIAFDGNRWFYVWMFVLTAVALVGFNAYGRQITEGMITTNMTDHVSWGLYIANFTYLVGLAAGAVMMVIPAYLYDDHEMHDVVIVGELLAIATIIMCISFVTVDLGRPDRFWHLLPGIGKFNWPISMLSWDVVVLMGYLLINLHITGYLIYTRFIGQRPKAKWYVPFVLLSIVWAISIHTVTAFLYSGLGGRPFWNTAILAPRFLMSAFVTGPAFIILVLMWLQRYSDFTVSQKPIDKLTSVLRVTVLGNMFMVVAEAFTQFYTGGHHEAAARYLYFGLHGHHQLVPWIWTAIVFNLTAAGLLLWSAKSASEHRRRWLVAACVLSLIGIWIEKGMGLIIPGFIPSTLGELVEYSPSITEWQITAGIWAMGLGIFTVILKITIQVLTGKTRLGQQTIIVPRGE